MAIPTIDTNAVGGLKTIQDLYNMLAGESTTTSGGTTTTTEGISGEGMNEMLKSALANTNGLAAISSGQRTAGGYGSSVNTMLTNDLLTRTASQIAQQNKTTTKTTTPTTTTKGGVTSEGATKALSITAALQGLQELDKATGASKKFKEWSNSNSSDTSAPSVGTSAMVDAYSQGGPSTGVYGSPQTETAQSSGDSSSGMDFDPSSVIDYGSYEDIGITEESFSPAAPMEEDPLAFLEDLGFADGGEVSVNSKNRPNVLGTSQFNRVVDSRAGKIGGGAGQNDPNATPESGTSASSNSTNQGGQSSGSSSSRPSGDAEGGTLGKFVNTLATDDGQKFSKVIGTLGKLTQSPVLQQAGLIGGIVTSDKPVQNAAIAAGNIATKGALGTGLNLVKTIKDPSIANAVDFTAALNPMTAGINGVLKMLGFRSIGDTAGDVANNVELRSTERNHMSPEQQQAAREWAENQGQEVSENPDVVTTPVEGPGTVETTDLDSLDGGSSGRGWSEPGDQGNGVTTSPVTRGEVTTTNLGPAGGSDGFMHGGEISGPGTGTSDSIHAKLSDGETVITAQTTAKVKELFGEDFFHNLEKQFNAPAAVKQKMKGRA